MRVDNIINRVKKLENIVTDQEVAKILQVDKRTLAGWKLRNTMRIEHLEEYVETRDISWDWILEGVGNPFRGLVKLEEIESAKGIGRDEVLIPIDKGGYIIVPSGLDGYGFERGMAALIVHDNTMDPILREGRVAICSKANTISTGGIYYLRHDDEWYFRRIIKNSSGYTLQCEDKNIPDLSLKREDFEIKYRVVATIAKL